MTQAVLLSLVTACVAFTLADSALFAPWRDWLKHRSSWLGKLASCGYCTGFWVAFALVALYRPRLFDHLGFLDYLLTAFVIAWLAAFQWALLCWLMDQTGK